MAISIPRSLGNGYCMCGFLFITDERNFLYYSLYILTEKSLKHLCSIRAWVPVSFFLSLSLFSWFPGAQRPVLLTLLPGLLRFSQEGALCLHPPLERAPGAFVRDTSPVSRTLLVFGVNQGVSASFSLSLSYHCRRTTRSRSIKGPQQSFQLTKKKHLTKFVTLSRWKCSANWEQTPLKTVYENP